MATVRNIDLKRRIIDLSFKHKASHIGSCLTAVDIIEEIFKKKKPTERFVLSNGHAAMALYVVLEKHLKMGYLIIAINVEKIIEILIHL